MRIVYRYTTLLEVLIALALTAAVLTVLSFFYREMSVIDTEIEKVKAEQFKLRYVENRLSDILPKAVSEKTKYKDFVFFSTNDEGMTLPGTQSLIFTYDNGVSLDSPFSNHVLGRLYVDLEGKLTLMYWPSPKRWEQGGSIPRKKEILIDGVDELSFMFFHVENDADLNGNEEESDQAPNQSMVQGEMTSQLWRQDFKKLPIMVRVTVGLKASGGNEKEEMVFIFPLPNGKTHVVYE